MKKNSLMSMGLALAIVSTVFFSSCKKEDTSSPTITLNGAATMTMYVGETFTDPGVTCDDLDAKEDEVNLTADVVKTGAVDNTKSGEYIIRYNCEDEAGNAANEVTRTVTVKHKNSTVQGLYSATESCTGVPSGAFSCSVNNGTTETGITISNFGNYGVVVNATLSGTYNTTVTVTSQNIAGATFSGTGTVEPDGKKMTITYTADDGVNSVTCTKTLTR